MSALKEYDVVVEYSEVLVTVKARNEEEAMRKAEALCDLDPMGPGSITPFICGMHTLQCDPHPFDGVFVWDSVKRRENMICRRCSNSEADCAKYFGKDREQS